MTFLTRFWVLKRARVYLVRVDERTGIMRVCLTGSAI